MTNEELQKIFNQIHSTFTAAIYDYNKTLDFKKMHEAVLIFEEFITLYQQSIIANNDEKIKTLIKLSFRNIEKDKEFLK